MKITAVRVIENKEPVGVFGGWMSDSSLDLNLIRECMDTDACEFIESDIPRKMFGVIWAKIRQEGETLPSEMKFTFEVDQRIRDIFTVGYFQWENFAEQESADLLFRRMEDMKNNEIDYLNEKILERELSLQSSYGIITTSIMFMFVSWIVAFISIALLILK